MRNARDLESRIDAERKEEGEKIDVQLAGAKELLNALLGLTALASLIIGFLTYMSVKYARDEAKDQVEIFRKRLEELEAKFPEFGGLDERIRQKLREVEVLLPTEANWNDVVSFRKLREGQKQQILDNEIAISASISVFGLDRSPAMRTRLVAIYSAFARFYSARYDATSNSSESDYVRAVSYATRAIELSPEAIEGYRLRGAIYLARYDRGSRATPPEEKGSLDQLLDLAEADLKFATSRKNPLDAGAFYDLAILQHYRENTTAAVEISRELIQGKDKISAMHRSKYLPDTYRNLACYLSKMAEGAGNNTEKEKLSKEAVDAVRQGMEEFKPADRGRDELKDGIEGELKAGGDLAGLEQTYRDQIAALLT